MVMGLLERLIQWLVKKEVATNKPLLGLFITFISIVFVVFSMTVLWFLTLKLLSNGFH